MSSPLIYIFVTGAEGAKNAPELIRRVVDAGWNTYTVLTSNVSEIISPDEIRNVPGNQVIDSYHHPQLRSPVSGTILIAPCTFNTFNKVAQGIADNLATAMIADALGGKCPVYIAPAMRSSLWNHPQTKESEAKLKAWGCHIIPLRTENNNTMMASIDDILQALPQRSS